MLYSECLSVRGRRRGARPRRRSSGDGLELQGLLAEGDVLLHGSDRFGARGCAAVRPPRRRVEARGVYRRAPRRTPALRIPARRPPVSRRGPAQPLRPRATTICRAASAGSNSSPEKPRPAQDPEAERAEPLVQLRGLEHAHLLAPGAPGPVGHRQAHLLHHPASAVLEPARRLQHDPVPLLPRARDESAADRGGVHQVHDQRPAGREDPRHLGERPRVPRVAEVPERGEQVDDRTEDAVGEGERPHVRLGEAPTEQRRRVALLEVARAAQQVEGQVDPHDVQTALRHRDAVAAEAAAVVEARRPAPRRGRPPPANAPPRAAARFRWA